MINLDNQSAYQSNDSLPLVIESIDKFPKQLEQAWKKSSQIEFPQEFKEVENVVVCGMGGSRFTPFAVRELFKEKLTVPYIINDNYTLPGFVNEKTLVILSSYSGTTEEVIECGKQALAQKSKVTAVTSGGTLVEMLRGTFPYYQFEPTYNPSNQPRIGGGYMIAGHMGIMYTTGLINLDAQEIEKSITALPNLLNKYTIGTPKAENGAKQLAELIYQKYPYIVTSEFLQGFGNAFGNSLNETAKIISSPRVIPEINHHMMEGLQFPSNLKDLGLFIFFFSNLYHPRIQKRFAITKEVVEQNGLITHQHTLNGATKIEQLFEAIALGSYVTMYLSVLYKQDPNKIPWVDLFKKRLKD